MLRFLSSICPVVIFLWLIVEHLVRFAGTVEPMIGFMSQLLIVLNGTTFIIIGKHVQMHYSILIFRFCRSRNGANKSK